MLLLCLLSILLSLVVGLEEAAVAQVAAVLVVIVLVLQVFLSAHTRLPWALEVQKTEVLVLEALAILLLPFQFPHLVAAVVAEKHHLITVLQAVLVVAVTVAITNLQGRALLGTLVLIPLLRATREETAITTRQGTVSAAVVEVLLRLEQAGKHQQVRVATVLLHR